MLHRFDTLAGHPVARAAFWGCCAVITTLALLPAQDLSPLLFNWWDKAQHALAFAVLTTLGLLAYPHRPALAVGGGLLALGGAIEIAQLLSGWRQGDWQDGLADGVGILCILLIHRLLQGNNIKRRPLEAGLDAQ